MILLGVILAVLLAGCSAGGSTGGTPTVTDTSGAGDAGSLDDLFGEGTPTPAPNVDRNEGESTPAGSASDGTTADVRTDTGGDDDADGPPDPEALAATDPEARLAAVGSYTSVWTFTTNNVAEHSATSLVFEHRIDHDARRAYTSTRIEGAAVQVMENFYADGMQYSRVSVNGGEQVTHMASETTWDARSRNDAYGFMYDYSEFDRYEFDGTTTYDGVPVRRYVFEASQSWLDAGQLAGDDVDVDTASFEILVDADGIPRFQRYHVTGVDRSGTEVFYDFEFTITDVGSTTVADPGWLGQARQQAR